MSQGFLAVNDNNQVLISSDTRNLHFIQKLTGPRNTTLSISDPDAGILVSVNVNGGIRRWRYTATCSVTPVPFFTMPTNDQYGILRIQDKGSNRWDIEIFRSGTSNTVPELYIFADARASSSVETHGMLVLRDDGTPSFDSRLRPLTVNSAVTVTHPDNPRTVSDTGAAGFAKFCTMVEADLGYLFQSSNYNFYSINVVGAYPQKPIFSFLSIAQSNRQFTASADESVKSYNFGIEYETRHDYWWSYYWQFYRGVIKNPVTATGLHTVSTDTLLTLPGQPYFEINISSPYFYNKGANGVWEQRATPSGDDGLWFYGLPWDIYFTNTEGTAAVPYNVMLLSTNGYITFNYYNNSTGVYRDLDAGSFEYLGLETASTLAGARIMIYAGDNSTYNWYAETTGTAPNRVYRIRYTGYAQPSGWFDRATVAPNLIWEMQFPENKTSEINVLFPSTINVRAGAVLGVGTSHGWQYIAQEPSAGTITPKNLIIKKGRAVADYQASAALHVGWATHTYGCNNQFYSTAGGGFFGGFFGGSTSSTVGGVWPYSNETLNLANNTVIVSDGSKYD
jgi:hypothetical protein